MIHISATQLKERMQREDMFLLDVREPSEHSEFNIGGQLAPLDTIIANAEKIPTDKPVIVYCKKGIRSQIAIQRLQEKFGFTNLINLQGGVDAWKKLIG
jgi:rhodanese-related sulfurtransferase